MSKVSTHRRIYGQFFTPEAVVACCYGLIEGDLPSIPVIIDPACGDGVFLRYAFEHSVTSPERIIGCELDAALVAELVGSGLLGVRQADGLAAANLPAGAFDLVVGNPPFGVTTSSEGRTSLASEVRFLLRALELAQPGGLIALILPSGVLANERLRPLRDDLLARCTVLAAIALPRDTFRWAGTDAACSILLLRNAPAPTDHRVFFAQPARLDDLPAVVVAYHNRVENEEWRLEIKPSEGQSLLSNPQSPIAFWLAQAELPGRRMDPPFWQPAHRALIEGMAARNRLRPLGELIERRRELIAGDHVRPSRGEAKGPGLPHEYYQTREFMAAGYNYARLERCDELAYRRLRYTAVQRHDLLVSCAGVGGAGRGRVCLVLHQPATSCTGDVLILRVRRLNPVFLFLFLASQAGRGQLLRLQNGVSTVNLSVAELLQVEVPLIAPAAQANIAANYAPIAAAHHAAMAALLRADESAFQCERARSEALLAELLGRVETLLIGGEP
jgi:predicted RNA methylase